MKNFKITRTVLETSFVMANDEQEALGYFQDGEVIDNFYEDIDDCTTLVIEEVVPSNNDPLTTITASEKYLTMITASEKYLSFDGYVGDAKSFVDDVRETYNKAGEDMPKVLNDFIFNIEVELQFAGVLDKDFNVIE